MKSSTYCPRALPAELSMVISLTAKVEAPSMLISCTGEFLKFKPVMDDVVKLWA